MALVEILMTVLGKPIAKFLLKKYLAEPLSGAGEGLLEIAGIKITEYSQRKEAERQFERLGEQIVTRLLPIFTPFETSTDVNPEAVAQ